MENGTLVRPYQNVATERVEWQGRRGASMRVFFIQLDNYILPVLKDEHPVFWQGTISLDDTQRSSVLPPVIPANQARYPRLSPIPNREPGDVPCRRLCSRVGVDVLDILGVERLSESAFDFDTCSADLCVGAPQGFEQGREDLHGLRKVGSGGLIRSTITFLRVQRSA
jgi:hypothetical protein